MPLWMRTEGGAQAAEEALWCPSWVGEQVSAVKWGARPCAGWVEPALISSCLCGLRASLARRQALQSRWVSLLFPHLLGKGGHQPPSWGG